MITKVKETFESTYYDEQEKAFIASSNIAFLSLKTQGDRDITDIEKKGIKKLVDYFDHSSVSKNNTKFSEFIKLESSRYILTDLTISRSIYSKLLFIIVENYLKEKNLDIMIESVSVTDSQDIETIVTREDLPEGYGTHLYVISEETFTS